MVRMKNEIGNVYGRLTVISRAGKSKSNGNVKWNCLCSCSNSTIVDGGSLRRGNTRSCGCLSSELASEARKTHGMSNTQTYGIWAGIHDRCNNQNNTKYKYYGARGIKRCKRWDKFENFLEDMGEKPGGLSIDRIDNNGDYCNENCKWSTDEEQQNNRRNNKKYKEL